MAIETVPYVRTTDGDGGHYEVWITRDEVESGPANNIRTTVTLLEARIFAYATSGPPNFTRDTTKKPRSYPVNYWVYRAGVVVASGTVAPGEGRTWTGLNLQLYDSRAGNPDYYIAVS